VRRAPGLSGELIVHCPFCGADDTKVIDSRLVAEGDQVRRRRECLTCTERFTTFETAELVMPRIVKSNGAREPFNEDKLRAGLQRALEKRPVSTETLESALHRVMHRLRSTGERELPSRKVGELVMEELKEIDDVAYVRFASVYRDFQDIAEFQAEIAKLTTTRKPNVLPIDSKAASVNPTLQDNPKRRQTTNAGTRSKKASGTKRRPVNRELPLDIGDTVPVKPSSPPSKPGEKK